MGAGAAQRRLARGKWWEIYNDPELNALEEQVSLSNQNLKAAEAQFREAKLNVRIARSYLYPTVTTAPSIVNSRSSVTGTANGSEPLVTHHLRSARGRVLRGRHLGKRPARISGHRRGRTSQ